MNIKSMQEWLASWGDGPNWTDPTGCRVPIAKTTMQRLLAQNEKMRAALQDLRSRALDGRNSSLALGAAFAAIADEALCEDESEQ